METKNKFAEWLQYELDDRGWSQADLSRFSNVTTGAISRVMSGTRNPGTDFCISIARALKVEPESVFRIAGLLPPKYEVDPRLEEINTILPQLPERDQKEIVELVRLKLRLAEERGEYNVKAEGTP